MRVSFAHRRPVRIEMVPLIDTFFLLLAFFISSVLTMEVARGLPVELPKAGKRAALSSGDRLIVTLLRDGGIELDGEKVTLEALSQRLSSHPRGESLQVAIRADRKSPYEDVVRVLGIVREAGVAKVTLLTRPKEWNG